MTHRRRPTDNEVDAYIDRERQAEGSEYERVRESLWLAAIRRADEEEFGPDLAVALPQYVDVVIDDEDPAAPAFVEIENQDGASVRIGEDVDQHDGYRRIRIRAADLGSPLDSPGRRGLSAEDLAAHLRDLEHRYGLGNEPQRSALAGARAALAERMGR